MMMPANYSAIAEVELTYVDGGANDVGALSSNGYVSTFTSNILTIIGNSFVGKVVSSTLGVLFGGSYTAGAVSTGIASGISTAYGKGGVSGIANAGLQIVGGLLGLVQLTLVDVAPLAKGAAMKIDGTK